FWTENIFRQKTMDLYLQSIENQKELQSQPIADWNYILTKVKETESLRPTLYDLLAHRAIQFFNTENNYYYRGNYDAKSNQEKKEKILEILENLSAFHFQKNNQDAYLYNQLELLKTDTNDTDSDEYLNELTALSKKFPTANYNAYILFEIANFHLNKAANEEPKAFDKKKTATEKTLSVLNEIQSRYPKFPILIEAEKLQKQILSPDFQIQI